MKISYRNTYSRLFVIIILFILTLTSSFALAAKNELVFGVFPRKGFTVTIHNFTPITRYLSSQLAENVRLVPAKDFSTFWNNVKNKKYDIVHYNQYHYIRSHKQFGYQVIAKNEENGSSNIAGVIVTHKNSGINSLADLKGKTIVFGGSRMAMQSYIVASYLLKQAHLEKSDYIEKFASTPVNAIFAAYYGTALAAGAANANLHVNNVTRRIDSSQIKILAKGENLSHLPWAVKSNMSKVLRKKIQELLVQLKDSSEGLNALNAAELTDIKVAKDEDYNRHRIIVKSVLGENY